MLNRPDLPTNGLTGIVVGFIATILGIALFPKLIKGFFRLFSGVLVEAGMVLIAGILTEKAAEKLGD